MVGGCRRATGGLSRIYNLVARSWTTCKRYSILNPLLDSSQYMNSYKHTVEDDILAQHWLLLRSSFLMTVRTS